jgi:predicted membrane protein
MLQNTGAVISIAFVMAIITNAIPTQVLFAIFSGVTSGLSSAQLDPFIANMHTALWVLAGTSVVGALVSLLRPKAVAAEPMPCPPTDYIEEAITEEARALP